MSRTKGSKNAINKTAKKLMLDTLAGQSVNLDIALERLYKEESPKVYLEIMSKYIGYVLAKQTSNVSEINNKGNGCTMDVGNGEEPFSLNKAISFMRTGETPKDNATD